ncbi:MAG TPA: hypothetical protein VH062_02055 [Polyangiaceae bacterium]|jgi:hypothetical protein|nr:hypothetical protein [Polyangiaceae bacterium]
MRYRTMFESYDPSSEKPPDPVEPFENPQPEWRLVGTAACRDTNETERIILFWTWEAPGHDVPPGSGTA